MLSLDNTVLARERKRNRLISLLDQWIALMQQGWEIDVLTSTDYTDEFLQCMGTERRKITDKEVDEYLLNLMVVTEQKDKVIQEINQMYKELRQDKPRTQAVLMIDT
jgi:hypothetical protein